MVATKLNCNQKIFNNVLLLFIHTFLCCGLLILAFSFSFFVKKNARMLTNFEWKRENEEIVGVQYNIRTSCEFDYFVVIKRTKVGGLKDLLQIPYQFVSGCSCQIIFLQFFWN